MRSSIPTIPTCLLTTYARTQYTKCCGKVFSNIARVFCVECAHIPLGWCRRRGTTLCLCVGQMSTEDTISTSCYSHSRQSNNVPPSPPGLCVRWNPSTRRLRWRFVQAVAVCSHLLLQHWQCLCFLRANFAPALLVELMTCSGLGHAC